MGCVVSVMPHLLYPQEGDLVPTVQEAGWAPGTVWMGAEVPPPLGFNPWTIQTIGNRYSEYIVPAQSTWIVMMTSQGLCQREICISFWPGLAPDIKGQHCVCWKCANILSLKFLPEALFEVGTPETFESVLVANNIIISHCHIPLEKHFIYVES
jgi:hypothetical protein